MADVAKVERRIAELGMTLEQLSEKSRAERDCVSPSTLRRIRNGEAVDRRSLASAARLLGIPPAEIEQRPASALVSSGDAPSNSMAPAEAPLFRLVRDWRRVGIATALLGALALAVAGASRTYRFSWSPTELEGVVVSPGTFLMGSPSDEAGREPDEGPVTEVTITPTLWVKTAEVTNAEWEEVFSSNPSTYRGCGANCPVTHVSWWDSVAWCNERSRRDGYQPCYAIDCSGKPGDPAFDCESVEFRGLQCDGYRLPTEAEWEYFARAGTKGAIYAGNLAIRGKNWGDGLDPIAWYGGNAKVNYQPSVDCSTWQDMEVPADRCGPHPIKQKQPNAWGLYDILGNVSEWTSDAYLPQLAGTSVTDPLVTLGRVGTYRRAHRGGGWDFDARYLRMANRTEDRPSARLREVGFRPVRTVPAEQTKRAADAVATQR